MCKFNSCSLIIKHYQYIYCWIAALHTAENHLKKKKKTCSIFTQYCILYSLGNGYNNHNALNDKSRHSC